MMCTHFELNISCHAIFGFSSFFFEIIYWSSVDDTVEQGFFFLTEGFLCLKKCWKKILGHALMLNFFGNS